MARPERRKARRKVTAEQAALLDRIERAVAGIRWPVDNASVFQAQVEHVLDRAGLYVAREVPMSGRRRVDVVVVDRAATVAVELDKFVPSDRSLGKFRDLPADVLRVLVLRRRVTAPRAVPGADRVVCLRATLAMVATLCDPDVTDMADAAIRGAQLRRRSQLTPLRENLLTAAPAAGRRR